MIKAISKRPKFYHPFKGNMLKEYAKKISLSLPLHHMFIELFAPMAHATTDGHSLSHKKIIKIKKIFSFYELLAFRCMLVSFSNLY